MIFNQHIDKRQANWMKTFIEHNEVDDEIKYLDINDSEKRDFFSYSMETLSLSYIDQFPHNYKIAGFSIFRNLDSVQYNRSTYDLLACIGDIGGLEGAVLLFGGYLMKWFSSFLATVYFMPHIFYYRTNAQPEEVVQY